ncbi:MAG: hypothetical protein QOH74_1169 [Gaiellales bacterium]|nr:hypothetical protein [Gaiellales bacterium]
MDRHRAHAIAFALTAVVGLTAVVSALSGSHSDTARPRGAPGTASTAINLTPARLRGKIWITDARCRLVEIDLETLGRRLATRDGGHCRFWFAPHGDLVAMHVGAPFRAPADIEVLDIGTGRRSRPFRQPDLAVAPPAWSPDGRRLVACDGRAMASRLVSVAPGGGTVRTIRSDACFPGFAGGRLAYRDMARRAAVIARTPIADAGSLTGELGVAVDQLPGMAAEGSVVAVPATTIGRPGGPAPDTVLFLYDAGGQPLGRWDTGVTAREVWLTGGGRFAAVADTHRSVLVRDLRTGRLLRPPSGPAFAAAASPDLATVALAGPTRLWFLRVADGTTIGSLPAAAGWLGWTR